MIGRKHCLSLRIALIDPRMVFMDEPATGLLLGAIVTGRSKVIHPLCEEADTLCSRIAIMAVGPLRCVGTRLHFSISEEPLWRLL